MNEQWRIFMQNERARIAGNGGALFPEAPAGADCCLCDLSHLGLIRAHGEDALSFLQGQLTSDVRKVSAVRSQLSSYCSPKGRMLASFRVFKRGDDFYLQLPRENLEPILKRLRMYLLRARATLEDAGERAAGVLEREGDAPQKTQGEVTPVGDLSLLRHPGEPPRFQVVGPAVALQGLWERLAATATPVNADYWAWLDIRAGIPTGLPQTAEAFVPQMANMELVDGVSFSKGCYTGQEVVARSQYLGKLKRRMYLAHVDCETTPHPGDELFSPGAESGQTGGKLVDARRSPGGGYDLLAVIPSGIRE